MSLRNKKVRIYAILQEKVDKIAFYIKQIDN